jgi:arylsulfatase A
MPTCCLSGLRGSWWLALGIVSVWAVLGMAGFSSAAAPPNVVLVLSDDQGWGDVESHGNPWIKTPAFNQLRQEGASLEQFYVSPLCAPTRASLLTGRYHIRCGVHGVTGGTENMRAEELTLAERFRAAGYATGCFGKWHNGAHFPLSPTGQGFEEFTGFCAGHWNNYFDAPLEDHDLRNAPAGYITEVFANAAIQFIERHQDRPFFCYVPFNAPHTPWQVPEADWQRHVHDDVPPEARCAYAMVENLDHHLGRILQRLDELKLKEKTIVIFLTDNGPNTDRYNGGMRGKKGSLHEGGTRAPCFIRWPDTIAPGLRISQVAMHADLLPTLLELCGLPVESPLPLDGRSLAPLLRQDGNTAWPDRILLEFKSWGAARQPALGAARNQKYRAVRENARRGWELFDIESDPQEAVNVAADHPEVLRQLQGAFDQVVNEVKPWELAPVPVSAGVPGHPDVTLLAHEGSLLQEHGGGVGFHSKNGYANDWVDFWTSPQTGVTWPLQVVQAGAYQVSVDYRCHASELQATLVLSAGDSRTQIEIDRPFFEEPAPSLDRIPRKGADEVAWSTQAGGVIQLSSGATTLRLTGGQKAGKEYPQVKAVRLRYLGP